MSKKLKKMNIFPSGEELGPLVKGFYRIKRQINNLFILKLLNIPGILYNRIFYFKYDSLLKESNDKLKELKDRHNGERCFIMATGPSLNKTNLSLLKDEHIIGMNTLYRGLNNKNNNIPIPKYYCIISVKLLIREYKKIPNLDTFFFLGGHAGRYYLKNKQKFDEISKNKPIVLKEDKKMIVFNEMKTNLLNGINGGNTVAIACLHLAYWLGFSEVYLVGADCDYSGAGHFDGEKGNDRPDKINRWFKAYKICKKAFEKDERKIYNATVGGKLEVFERKRLEEIIDK
jgi:hypothetical protein